MPKFNQFLLESKTDDEVILEATKNSDYGMSVSGISKKVNLTRMGTYKLISSTIDKIFAEIRKEYPKLDNYEAMLIVHEVLMNLSNNSNLEIASVLKHVPTSRKEAIRKDAVNHLGK